jgi:glutaredoxin 3
MNTKKIIVYSTPTCHYCTMAKNYFTKMGVQYEDMNVGMDRVAAQEMVKKSGQMGVPVIDIDGQIVVGFQPEVFEKLINFK